MVLLLSSAAVPSLEGFYRVLRDASAHHMTPSGVFSAKYWST